MPANKEDEQALIRMYKELWGFNDADAKEEAATIMARGPSSDIYKSRMEMAQQHADAQEDSQRRAALTKAVWSSPPDPAVAAQEALNKRRAALASPDPAAVQAQEALNQRRASLALAAPSPPLPTWATEAAAQPPQPSQPLPPPTNQPAPPPIAPTPLTPAAQTPQHLEDANLSSWQQFAQFLGYPIRRR